MKLSVGGVEVEDTFCEAFDGLVTRILVTAKNEKLLKKAVYSAVALPCTVFGESEGGVESWVSEELTPDKRPGALIQFWVGYGSNAKEKLEYEMSKRIRQGILVTPTTRVFNALEDENKLDTMEKIGHCGDGYEWVEKRYGREMINIPLMMGEFLIERKVGYKKGVMGGNIWFFCESEDAALKAGEIAVEAVEEVEGTVTPFDICSAGSKVETNFPEIGPTTNHPYCPTLREKIKESKVPKGVVSIPEIVINGLNEEVVKKAMKVVIERGAEVEGVVKISAGNFGGKLGKHKLYLREVLK